MAFLVVFGWGGSKICYAETITLIAPPDVIKDYQSFMSGRAVETVRTYGGKHARFDVIELLLFQQALYEGGFRGDVKLIPQKNFQRIVQKVGAGQVTASGASVWRSVTDKNLEKFYISSEIVPSGKLETGFFTAQSNSSALIISSVDQLKSMSVVSNRNWTKSWAWLTSISLGQLYNHTDWPSMVKMVSSGRADIVMAPFPLNSDRRDLTLTVDGVSLLPVRGIKVVSGSSRHFIVSQNHPEGKSCFNYLKQGLEVMKSNNTIYRAFVESGVYNDETSTWKVIGRRPD